MGDIEVRVILLFMFYTKELIYLSITEDLTVLFCQ